MAIKYLAINKPDLVLLDYEMPEEIKRAIDEFFQKRKAMGKA